MSRVKAENVASVLRFSHINMAAEAAIANHLAPGYSAYTATHTPTARPEDDSVEPPADAEAAFPLQPDASNIFTNPNVDLMSEPPNPDPADVSASHLARFDRAYFRRLNINARSVRVTYGGTEGRLDVAIGSGPAPFELMVRTPTLTCKFRPHVWPLGDNKVDNPQSKFGAEPHELYKARYNLVVAPYATDDASTDIHGRNLHAVHFFNWCHRLTHLVHKRVCDDLPQVVAYAGSRMRDAYNAIAKQRREKSISQEEAEAMFRLVWPSVAVVCYTRAQGKRVCVSSEDSCRQNERQQPRELRVHGVWRQCVPKDLGQDEGALRDRGAADADAASKQSIPAVVVHPLDV